MSEVISASQVRGRFNAVVFDLDGTLIDSAPDVRAALNRALAAFGRREIGEAEIVEMMGHGASPMIDKALRATGEPLAGEPFESVLRRYLECYMEEPALRTIVFAGVRETVTMLHDAGIKLGICTNKPHQLSLAVLEALGLRRYFSAVLGGDAVPEKKPHPEHLLATLRELGVHASRAIYVGDSGVDVETARNAGVPVIVLNHGYSARPAAELGADLVIDGFAGFPASLLRCRAAGVSP
jgi:phosphoglycolate phosphatase